jgi:hypothetical protein
MLLMSLMSRALVLGACICAFALSVLTQNTQRISEPERRCKPLLMLRT